MKLNDDLKANSTPMEAKLKGISMIGKYGFGPYRIVSGKTGWGSSKSGKGKFNTETSTVSKSKSSFVFTVYDKDTILVNTSTNTKFSESESQFLVGDMTTLMKSIDNYIALIFVIISDGTNRKTWIFINNALMSMFQEYRSISRKYQIMPHLLLNTNVTDLDRHDQVRIAIMSRCLNEVLNQP